MAETSVAVLVGSLRKDSINRKLAQALTRLAPSHLSSAPATSPEPIPESSCRAGWTVI
jgi:NAD(P)H-dependent FMN reductase